MVKLNVGDVVELVNAGYCLGRGVVRHAKNGDRGVVLSEYTDSLQYVMVQFYHGYKTPNWMAERFEKADGPW